MLKKNSTTKIEAILTKKHEYYDLGNVTHKKSFIDYKWKADD
ncbi:MAG: hypothetical protein ACI9N1_001599 [Flavobacteriales bacterium]|jgi:hypothetical protein